MKIQKNFHYGLFENTVPPPSKILTKKRLLSIRKMLSMNRNLHREVAQQHAMRDAKDLDNFVRRHLGVAPSRLRDMSVRDLENKLEKERSNFKE